MGDSDSARQHNPAGQGSALGRGGSKDQVDDRSWTELRGRSSDAGATARFLSALFGKNGRASPSLEERYLLFRQLHILQEAGVPLLSGLQALQAQLTSPSLKQLLRETQQDLLQGRTLSQALARHPKAFGPVELGLIRVGEAGGLLDESLQQLAHLLEWEIELRNQLREVLQYPLIVLATLSVALTVMVVVVLPRFTQLFQSFRIPLPLQTRFLMGLSDVVAHQGWLILLLLIGVVMGWRSYLRTEAGHFRWHRWKLRLPVVGPVFLELAMSRFARVTAALHRSGVSILETLVLAGQSMNNTYVQHLLGGVRERVKGGDSLAHALKAEPLFPPIVVQMVSTGEEAGRLDELLRSVSDYYDQQVRYFIKRLVTSLEPMLLIVVGMGVLFMATSVLVPMWDLVRVFNR